MVFRTFIVPVCLTVTVQDDGKGTDAIFCALSRFVSDHPDMIVPIEGILPSRLLVPRSEAEARVMRDEAIIGLHELGEVSGIRNIPAIR